MNILCYFLPELICPSGVRALPWVFRQEQRGDNKWIFSLGFWNFALVPNFQNYLDFTLKNGISSCTMVYFVGHFKNCLKVQKFQPSYIVWSHALSSDQCFGIYSPLSLSRDGRLDWVSLYLFKSSCSLQLSRCFGRDLIKIILIKSALLSGDNLQ